MKALHPADVVRLLYEEKVHKEGVAIWEIYNELKPVDLYCYLYSKYGPPNGLQTIFRSDDSDNLIHWQWTLYAQDGLVSFQGHNFGTEIHLIGPHSKSNLGQDDLIYKIKTDFSSYGKNMSLIRKSIEKWTQFINPFQRIESIVVNQFVKLNDLNIQPEKDRVPHPKNTIEVEEFRDRWAAVSKKYKEVIGISFGLRSMLPVLAESFVNLILFILYKPDVKSNKRLFQNALRQPIDIRVQSLHMTCLGFEGAIDYQADACKAFHTLMNERNDLLHGNVEVSKLRYGEVYFNGKVLLFIEYGDFREKSIGRSLAAVKAESIFAYWVVVNSFIQYILSRMDENVSTNIKYMMSKYDLGLNNESGRIGVLFPSQMVDFRLGW